MRFVKDLRVRFGHTDPARIAYYPRYFEWFHDGMEDFFEEAFGMSYAEVLDTHGVGYPAVQVACEWRGPSRFGDLCQLEVFLSRLTERSATFEYRLRREGRLLATATVKTVGMHMSEHRAQSFPEAVMQVLSQYVERDDEHPNTERLRG